MVQGLRHVMNGNERLANSVKWRTRAKPKEAVKLGDILTKLMDKRLSPRQAKFEAITELWQQLLPANLCQHCKIVDMSNAELKVSVDSPSYANELRWCSSELLEQLQQRCPRARIKKIKFTVG